MTKLNSYGYNSHVNELYIPFKEKGLTIGRTTAIHGYKYHLITEAGEVVAEIAGTLYNSKENWELPKVGDWVVGTQYEEGIFIVDVLARQNELSRKSPGKGFEKQVMVTNIDFAMIVQSIDRDFNLMRIQRYLHQMYENGISPIVILNKCDLVPDASQYVAKVEELGLNIPVVLTSTFSGAGISDLKTKVMEEGKTYVLIGSSGVGKSSLLNSLCQNHIQETNTTSAANKKGKHTTTYRFLTKLPNGSILIDTPGMREFGLTADSSDSAGFIHPQIENLARLCKFPDCRHEQDPGCAIAKAVESGDLAPTVYKSYLKLKKEQQRNSITVWEKKKIDKQFGKMAKEAQANKKKWR